MIYDKQASITEKRVIDTPVHHVHSTLCLSKTCNYCKQKLHYQQVMQNVKWTLWSGVSITCFDIDSDSVLFLCFGQLLPSLISSSYETLS